MSYGGKFCCQMRQRLSCLIRGAVCYLLSDMGAAGSCSEAGLMPVEPGALSKVDDAPQTIS